MRVPPRLITFDIDGTLLKAIGPRANAAHHAAVNQAVAATYAISSTVTQVPYKGSTDMAIIRAMCMRENVPRHIIDSRLPAALADAASRIQGLIGKDADLAVLPGVIPLLEALRSRGIAVALATGNIERIAWVKLEAARIASYFKCGGFGSDAELRSDIVRKSVQRAGSFSHSDVVHVGDAIADVAAAREIGASGIGVLTGAFTREELDKEQPLAIFDDLSDTDAFLRAVGIAEDEAHA